jgi:hypothetical protein
VAFGHGCTHGDPTIDHRRVNEAMLLRATRSTGVPNTADFRCLSEQIRKDRRLAGTKKG